MHHPQANLLGGGGAAVVEEFTLKIVFLDLGADGWV